MPDDHLPRFVNPSTIAPYAARVERDVVTVAGPEAERYLQGQLSQDVTGLGAGEAARSFLLSPQGKVVAWLRVTRLGPDRFLLDVEPGFGGPVLTRLQRFKLRTEVDFESERWQTVAVRGDGSSAMVGPGQSVGAVAAVSAFWPQVETLDLLGPSVEVPVGLDEGSFDRYEAARVVAGVPAMGSEVDESTIPAELGRWAIDRSVSFTKGCYTGQELVARVDSRGNNVPRPIARLLVSARGSLDELRAVGSTLVEPNSGKEVGRLTSVAGWEATDDVYALGIVGRSVQPGTVLEVRSDEIQATAVLLPPPGVETTASNSN